MILSDLLETCGLNSSEQLVLLELLGSGELSASEVAKRVELKRTNVYAVLDNLQKAGLVSSRAQQHVKRYQAAEPDIICSIFENRARAGYDQVLRASELLNPSLIDIAQHGETRIADFQFSALESKAAVFSMLESLFQKGNFCAIFDPETVLTESMRPAITKWLKHSARQETHIREILIESDAADWYCGEIENPNHLIRRIPSTNLLETDMLIEEDCVTILSYERSQEVALKIVHPGYTASMKTLFEIVWNSAK